MTMGGISGLNEAITLSDTSSDVSILNTSNGNTTGTVNASTITTLIVLLQIAILLVVKFQKNENVTLSDTSTTVSVLNTLEDVNTTGTVNASTVTTLTGAAADCNTAYASDEISNRK